MKNDLTLKQLYSKVEQARINWHINKEFDTLDQYKYNQLGEYVINNYPELLNNIDVIGNNIDINHFAGVIAFFILTPTFGEYIDDIKVNCIYKYDGERD